MRPETFKNQKNFYPGKGDTPSPTALALCALAHTKYAINVAYSNLL